MPLDDDAGLFSLGQGCPVHGEDHMKECSMCGTEFCTLCFRKSAVCTDCADMTEDEDPDDNPDFEDVTNLDALLASDKELGKTLKDSDDSLDEEDKGKEDR